MQTAFLAAAGTPELTPGREFFQAIARQEAARQTVPDAALVSPRLRINPDSIELSTRRLPRIAPDAIDRHVAAMRERHDSRWVDLPSAALGGQTPRQAISDPAGRAKVIRLLKPCITETDHKRLLGHPETGPELIVRELGISELDVPPPPQRPCPRELAEEAAELAARGKAILIPPANGFLADEEIQARLAKIFDHYPDDEDLFHAWDAACPGLADLVGELAPTGSPIPIWNTSNSASPSPGRF